MYYAHTTTTQHHGPAPVSNGSAHTTDTFQRPRTQPPLHTNEFLRAAHQHLHRLQYVCSIRLNSTNTRTRVGEVWCEGDSAEHQATYSRARTCATWHARVSRRQLARERYSATATTYDYHNVIDDLRHELLNKHRAPHCLYNPPPLQQITTTPPATHFRIYNTTPPHYQLHNSTSTLATKVLYFEELFSLTTISTTLHAISDRNRTFDFYINTTTDNVSSETADSSIVVFTSTSCPRSRLSLSDSQRTIPRPCGVRQHLCVMRWVST
eukprot:71078-Amphidinium_carterae.1